MNCSITAYAALNRCPSLTQLLLVIVLNTYSLTGIAGEYVRPAAPAQDEILAKQFPEEEKTWLAQHPVIRVAVKDGWMPIEFKLESEKHQGISVDYLSAIASMLNVSFEVVDYAEGMSNSQVDMITGVGAIRSLEGTDFAPTSQPFLSFPYAIYVNRNSERTQLVNQLEDLRKLRVAIFKGARIHGQIEAAHPDIALINVEIADDAFDLLEEGLVDAYVGNEMVLDYHINVYRLGFVRKAGLTPFSASVTMAVRKDLPLLQSIMDRSILLVQPNNEAILNKWRVKEEITSIKVLKIIGTIALAIFLLVLARLYSLKQSLKKQARESQQQIWHQANYDFLTALPNRHLVEDRLKHAIMRASRSSMMLGLLFIDLDNFKQINDEFGHAHGDTLLIEAAERINQCTRAEDTAARFGGDEFVVLIADITDSQDIETVCHKILYALNEPFYVNGHAHYISASIGIAVYPDDSHDTQALISFADQAMYEAKKLGKNRYQFFTSSIQAASLNRSRISNNLKEALLENQFELYFQPISALANGQISKAEVLIRWTHPTEGIISPVDFIPMAETSGLIQEIGQWVFMQAVEHLKIIHQHVDANFQLSINVSPYEFQNPERLLGWLSHLESEKIPGHCIGLEITEGLLLEASESVIDVLATFHRYGIEISIDDFGTGYSALSYLKKFDVDYIKLDRSFVQHIPDSQHDSVLCEAIIDMAHKLGIKVIAEGIEHASQEAALKRFNCDFGQGYLFARPRPMKDLLTALQRQSHVADAPASE